MEVKSIKFVHDPLSKCAICSITNFEKKNKE